MKKYDSNGFGLVGVLAIIVIVGLLGVTGWLVYDRNNNNQATSTPVAGTPVPHEVAGGTTVTSKKGAFSIVVPAGWVITNYGNSDSMRSKTIIMSREPATVEEAATPYAGDSQFAFTAFVGTNKDYIDSETGEVTTIKAGSLTGKKNAYTYATDTAAGIGQRKKGDKFYSYRFAIGENKDLIFIYNVNAGEPDQVEDIDKVVQSAKVY